MATIPGLPSYLEEVPPAPNSRFDPERDAKRERWKEWRRDVLEYRLDHQEAVLSSLELTELEYELCRRSSQYFTTMWCWISEPRSGDGRSGGLFPAIPFEIQVELLEWLKERRESSGVDGDGVISKSRDMGASWFVVFDAVHGWIFGEPYSNLLISRNESIVDSKQSASLFWKMRFVIDRLPAFLRPPSYDRNDKDHNSKLALINPDNGNELIGESNNANAGRAARAQQGTFDEAAFIKGFLDVWNNMANTVAHRIGLSSMSIEEDTGFYRLCTAEDIEDPPPLFVMEWYHNPLNDDAWYEATEKRMRSKPGKFEAEVLRNPKAGDTTYVYPGSFDTRTDSDIHWIPGSPLWIAMDPGFGDETALIWIMEHPRTGKFWVLDAYERSSQPAAFYGCIILGHWEFLENKGVEFPFVTQFTDRDYEIMEWTATLPKCAVVGDSYGDNVSGATADSIYDVLRKPPFRLKINIDRTPAGDVTATKKQVRQFKPRRDALREMLPEFEFADTVGANNVLRALQEHKFMEETGRTTTEQLRPRHDWTSHKVSALEFFAANWKVRRQVGAAAKKNAERNRAANTKRAGSYNPYTQSKAPGYRTYRRQS
jgi:hypothetical protein